MTFNLFEPTIMTDEEYRTLCRTRVEQEESLSGSAALDTIFKDPNYGLSDEDYSASVRRLWDVKTNGERDRLISAAKALEEENKSGQPPMDIVRPYFFGLYKKRIFNPAFKRWVEDAPKREQAIKDAWAATQPPNEIREIWAAQMRSHLRVYRKEKGLDGAASLIEEAYRFAKTSHLWKV